MKEPEPVPPENDLLTDPIVFGRVMIDVAQRSQPIIRAFIDRQKLEPENEMQGQ